MENNIKLRNMAGIYLLNNDKKIYVQYQIPLIIRLMFYLMPHIL